MIRKYLANHPSPKIQHSYSNPHPSQPSVSFVYFGPSARSIAEQNTPWHRGRSAYARPWRFPWCLSSVGWPPAPSFLCKYFFSIFILIHYSRFMCAQTPLNYNKNIYKKLIKKIIVGSVRLWIPFYFLWFRLFNRLFN